MDDLRTDTELVKRCDVVLSVVPPRDAEATAQRLVDALQLVTRAPGSQPLYLAEMNAVSPRTVKRIAAGITAADVPITLIDGSILGGPPKPKAQDDGSSSTSDEAEWTRPLMPTSGPVGLADIPGFGARLAEVLNSRHVGPEVGASSGLKMCFASLTKGFSALAAQSYTTAHRLGVLPELRAAMGELAPARLAQADGALPGVPPKAWRWVHEMEEIARTHAEEGGFESEDLFRGVAGVFRAMAEDTVLGLEKAGQRKRGRTADDVAAAMAEGLEKKGKKRE